MRSLFLCRSSELMARLACMLVVGGWALPGCTGGGGGGGVDDTGGGGTGGTTSLPDYLEPDPEGDPEGWGLYIAQAMEFLEAEWGSEDLTVMGLYEGYSTSSSPSERGSCHVMLADAQYPTGMWEVNVHTVDHWIEDSFWNLENDTALTMGWSEFLESAPTQLLLDRPEIIEVLRAGPFPEDEYDLYQLKVWSAALAEDGMLNGVWSFFEEPVFPEDVDPLEPVVFAKAKSRLEDGVYDLALLSGRTGEVYGVAYPR